jgi:phytoene synthase
MTTRPSSADRESRDRSRATASTVALGSRPLDAYEHCRDLARMNATNFYYAIRLLPRPKREAVFAVYAMARRIDDVADGGLTRDEKMARLHAERTALDDLEEAALDDHVYAALADAAARFPIPLAAYHDLIQGAEMDVLGLSYERFDDLLVYCRRVGGSIGRLVLGVLEPGHRERSDDLADDLGVALQLTNILRDIREDAMRGRVYLPSDDLEHFGVSLDPPSGPVADLVRFEATRAREWFDLGLELLPLLERTSATCVATMAGIYRRLLDRIEREPEVVLRERVALAAWEKGWVVARSLVGAGT